MNILLTSDYHLDETRRFKDYQKSLIAIEEYSKKEKIDYYINGGDVFHGRHNPTPLELKVFSTHIANIVAKRKIIIVGNHETINENLSFLDWAKRITKLEIIPFFLETINKRRIYIAHRAIKEAEVGSYQIRLKELSYIDIQKKTKADIIILGHIHKAQLINQKNPLVVVLGSIERVSFSERNEYKMFWILNIDNFGKIKIKKINLFSRPMKDIIYNIDTKELLVNGEKRMKLNFLEIKNAILKVKVMGKKEDLKKINYDKFILKFKEAYKLNLIFEHTNIELKNNMSGIKVMNDIDILRTYCIKNKISKDIEKLCKQIIK